METNRANKTKGLLNDRIAINFLIKTFYAKVRKDDLLGPVFNSQVRDWPEHLERLTDFWETNLLFRRVYKGSPLKAHIDTDKRTGQSITTEHFGRWLQLWFETIDRHFYGEHADRAKNHARKMSTHLFMKIFQSRDNLPTINLTE